MVKGWFSFGGLKGLLGLKKNSCEEKFFSLALTRGEISLLSHFLPGFNDGSCWPAELGILREKIFTLQKKILTEVLMNDNIDLRREGKTVKTGENPTTQKRKNPPPELPQPGPRRRFL